MSGHSQHMQMDKNALVKGQVGIWWLWQQHWAAMRITPLNALLLLLCGIYDCAQVLMVATSHNTLGDSGKPTGLW